MDTATLLGDSTTQEKKVTLTSEETTNPTVTIPSKPEDNGGTVVETISISKNQQKKKRRYEKLMAVKKRKKEQDKEEKRARREMNGRNLEQEKQTQKAREMSGEGHKKRQEKWQKRMENSVNQFKICIDCSFDASMTTKEIGSLSNQIRYCYAVNKSSDNPVHFSVSSLSGLNHDNLKKVCGFPDQWKSFTCSEKSLLEMNSNNKDKLIYLTSDSDNTLKDLDDDKIYVIGGIVDRNRLKGATKKIAEQFGFETAKLPIDENVQVCSTKVLTCNHVFEILLKYHEHGEDWKKALLDVLPIRKDVKQVSNKD